MIEEFTKLRDQINYHDVLYHQKSKPEIADAEYDELKQKLVEMEGQLPGACATQDGVGAAPDEKFSKIKHHTFSVAEKFMLIAIFLGQPTLTSLAITFGQKSLYCTSLFHHGMLDLAQ